MPTIMVRHATAEQLERVCLFTNEKTASQALVKGSLQAIELAAALDEQRRCSAERIEALEASLAEQARVIERLVAERAEQELQLANFTELARQVIRLQEERNSGE
ncbi:hypothetical protein [Stutzerimonas kunmingensis]|uniref:hypothetical protein n=1 Tax=Stutzerimonas kunmingensis TaxID=1211807 RepID=UPI0028AD985A|nr:hypothetical protein [Stutzerimonas kunmingensis]